MGHVAIPSYRSGFYSPRRGGIPKYPQLWRGCVGAWCPSLGPTGLRLMDQSLYGNHGTLTNMDAASDWVVSGGRGALDFDATDDNLLLNRAVSFTNTNSFGFSFWMYPRQWLGNGGLWRDNFTGSTFCIFKGTTGKPWIRWNGSDILVDPVGSTVSLNAWQHCCYVVRPSRSEFWCNGVLFHTGSSGTATFTIPAFGYQNTVDQRIDGQFDDFLLYDRSLYESEIQLLSRRRGIAYELDRQRNRYAAPATGMAVPVFMHHYLQQGVA